MSLNTEDLKQIEVVLAKATTGLATKTDLKGLATKTDLKGLATKMEQMEDRLTASMGLLQRDIFGRLDQHELRLTRLEQSASK